MQVSKSDHTPTRGSSLNSISNDYEPTSFAFGPLHILLVTSNRIVAIPSPPTSENMRIKSELVGGWLPAALTLLNVLLRVELAPRIEEAVELVEVSPRIEVIAVAV